MDRAVKIWRMPKVDYDKVKESTVNGFEKGFDEFCRQLRQLYLDLNLSELEKDLLGEE